MNTRTICCKLVTTPPIAEALKETSERFADACNYVLKAAIAEERHNAIKMHKLCYTKVREMFGLSANLAVRSIRRVVACMTKRKGKQKSPKQFKPKSIDYDARIFSYREANESVSLTTTKGRIAIPMLLGEHQKRACSLKEAEAQKKFSKNSRATKTEELNTKTTFFRDSLWKKLKGTIAE